MKRKMAVALVGIVLAGASLALVAMHRTGSASARGCEANQLASFVRGLSVSGGYLLDFEYTPVQGGENCCG